VKRCYLAGPIQADPINATDWREYLQKELPQVGWLGTMPPGMIVKDLEKQQDDFTGWIRSGNWKLFKEEFGKVKEGDLRAVKACDALLVYLPNGDISSWGTKGEVYYADYLMKIPIYFVYPKKISTAPFWLLSIVKDRQKDTGDDEVIFRTFPEFVRYLKEKGEK